MNGLNLKEYSNICKWFKKLNSRKPTSLIPEKKEERLKRFTNFSLYHIMGHYEFVPGFILQSEYLFPLLYKNPEVLRQSHFCHYKFMKEGDTKQFTPTPVVTPTVTPTPTERPNKSTNKSPNK